jgi:arylsulfatase A-like enzyme
MPDWEGTLVLLIGDHGEGLSQHGEFSHRGIWEEQLRVPLMMRVPGERARRDSVLISAVDVFPTLLGFVDSDAFEPFFEQASGRDVFAGNGDGRFVLSQDSGQKMGKPDYRYSLTTERWKYIWFPDGDDEEDLLYDLTADPFELRDVSEENREVALALRDSLRAQLAAQTERGSELGGGQEVTEVPVDSMVLEELRALGYAVD